MLSKRASNSIAGALFAGGQQIANLERKKGHRGEPDRHKDANPKINDFSIHDVV